MAKQRDFQEHKYDTLSLLAGLSEENTVQYSLEDILREFGNEESEERKPEQDDRAEELVSQIQEAINHEMELDSVLPDPVINITSLEEAEEGQPEAQTQSADEVLEETQPQSEADAYLRSLGIRLVKKEQELPPMEEPEEALALPEETAAAEQKAGAAEKKGVLPEEQPKHAQESNPPEKAEGMTQKNGKKHRRNVTAGRPELKLEVKAVDESLLPDVDEDELPAQVTGSNDDEDEAEEKPKKPKFEAETVLPDAITLYHKVQKNAKNVKGRLSLAMLLLALSVMWTVFCTVNNSVEGFFADRAKEALVLLGITTLGLIPAWKTFYRGLQAVLRLRLTEDALLFLAYLLNAAAVLFTKADSALPACAVLCLGLYFAAWKDTLRTLAFRRIIKPVVNSEGEITAIVCDPAGYQEHSLLLRGAYDEQAFVKCLLEDEQQNDAMSWYAIAAFGGTLLMSIAVSTRTTYSILWAWSLLLSVAVPAGAFISFHRPFAHMSAEHGKKGILIAGFGGVRSIRSAAYTGIVDGDIFPKEKITMGGVKLYDIQSIGIAASYGAAVMEAAGSGLSDLFTELRNQHQGRKYYVSQFKRYEGGGYGAEVSGDIVLMGSRRFMQLMGIPLKGDTEIQGAVYMSVNGKLAALFVVNYKVTASYRRALKRVLFSGAGRPLFATCDFMLTPAMLEQYYKLAMERAEFPSAKKREAIAFKPGNKSFSCCGVLQKAQFPAYADAIADSVRVWNTSILCSMLSSAASAFCSLLLFALMLWSEKLTVSALPALVIYVASVVPAMVLTGKRKARK